MVPSSLFDQDYGSYANASVGLEVLRDRYRNFQLQLKKWIERKILEPIAKIQDFWVLENGEQKLVVPKVEFGKINLKETDTYLNQLGNHLADPANPGSGKISLQTWYELLDTDYQTEKIRLRQEAKDQIILAKEIEAMKNMDIVQLKTVSETTPILDSKEVDSAEKALNIKDQAQSVEAPSGAMEPLDLGLGASPPSPIEPIPAPTPSPAPAPAPAPSTESPT